MRRISAEKKKTHAILVNSGEKKSLIFKPLEVVAALSGFAVAALAVGSYASSSTVLADASGRDIASLEAEIAATQGKLYSLKQEMLAELQTELASEEAKRAAGAGYLYEN